MAELKDKEKPKAATVKDILDAPVIPERFYVSKIGVMKLIVDKVTLTVYQVQAKDAPALCKLMNELDTRSKL